MFFFLIHFFVGTFCCFFFLVVVVKGEYGFMVVQCSICTSLRVLCHIYTRSELRAPPNCAKKYTVTHCTSLHLPVEINHLTVFPFRRLPPSSSEFVFFFFFSGLIVAPYFRVNLQRNSEFIVSHKVIK